MIVAIPRRLAPLSGGMGARCYCSPLNSPQASARFSLSLLTAGLPEPGPLGLPFSLLFYFPRLSCSLLSPFASFSSLFLLGFFYSCSCLSLRVRCTLEICNLLRCCCSHSHEYYSQRSDSTLLSKVLLSTFSLVIQRSSSTFCFKVLLQVLIQHSASKFCFKVLLRRSASKFCFKVPLQSSASKFCLQRSASKFCFKVLLQSSALQSRSQVFALSSCSIVQVKVLLQSSVSKFRLLVCWRASGM